jgi:curved DNA-binding protein CbpA
MLNRLTLYEVLEISTDASPEMIEAAYQQLSERYAASALGESHELVVNKRKVLLQAYQTLANPASRAAYDAAMIQSSRQGKLSAARAQSQTNHHAPLAKTQNTESRLLTRLLTIIAGLMALGLLFQIVVVANAYRQQVHLQENLASDHDMSSEQEKVWLEDFYQRTGRRAASYKEAKLIEVELAREKSSQQRLQYQQEQAKRKLEAQLRESHYEAERVSQNLRSKEQMLRYEEESRLRRQQEEERQRQEQEKRRIEAEKRQWQAVIQRQSH